MTPSWKPSGPLAAALVVAVREETAKHVQKDAGPRYYDKKSFPWGQNSFERLTREGKIRSFKAPDGKTTLVLASEAHAFIESQEGAMRRSPRPRPVAPPVDVNELSPEQIVDRMIDQGVAKRAKGERDGPTTKRSGKR